MKKSLLLSLAFGMGSILSANAAWEEMEMKKYTDLQEHPVELVYTPTEDGVLTIRSWKGYEDPYLWSNEACTEQYYVPALGYGPGYEGEMIFTFALVAGKTYYSKAPANDLDNIIEIEYSWEPTVVGDVPEITPGKAFTNYVSSKYEVMKFEAEETGILKITILPYVAGLAGDTWSCLYEDYTHNIPVETLNPGGEYVGNGIAYYFKVTEGTTYYFYQNITSSAQFMFTMVEDVTVKILDIRPTPGKAFDAVNFIGGAQIFFSPLKVSFSKITFSYTDKDGVEISKDVKSDFYSDALMVYIYDYYLEALKNAENGSECTVTLYDVNFDGTPVTESDIEGVDLTDGNVSFSYIIDTPITIENAEWPQTMMAYWPAGDPQGIATLEFTGNVVNVAKVQMIMGYHYYNSPGDSDDDTVYPDYTIPYEIDGNKVKVDFTGVERSHNGFDVVTVMVIGVVGENGLQANYNGNFVLQTWIPYVNNAGSGDEPAFNVLETYELSYEAPSKEDYIAGYCEFDMDEVLGLLGCEVEDLAVISVEDGEILPQTGNNGYWYNAEGMVCEYGDAPAWYIEYHGNEVENAEDYNAWMIGNFPGVANVGATSCIGFYFEENVVLFNIAVSIGAEENPAPEGVNVLKTIDLSYSGVLNDDYIPGSCQFDADEVMELLGCTMQDVKYISLNEENEILRSTANEGYWYDFDGKVCNWGEGAAYFIEYYGIHSEEAEDLNNWWIGNYPGIEGADATSNIGFMYGDNAVMFNIHVVLTDEASIAGLAADAEGNFRVYNMQGMSVLNTSNAADLNSLKAGLYIINGKKVMIRK